MNRTVAIILIVVALVALLYGYAKKKGVTLALGKVPNRPPKVRLVYSKKMKPSDRPKITGSDSAVDVLRTIWSKQMDAREEFYVLLLDRSNRVLGYQLLSKGGITGTVADIRLLLSVALQSLATSIILAHNHPSGNLSPSQSDKGITHKIVDAGKRMDITVLDHIILTKDGYYSFADEGIL